MKLLIASSIVTVIGFASVCSIALVDIRQGEEALARQMLQNLATGIETDIARNIEIYDLSLRHVLNAQAQPDIDRLPKPVLHLVLFDHAATAKHFGALQVFNAEGRLVADASTLDPRQENRSDEEYFAVHRDNDDIGLFISRPMLHRGSYAIVLSRRISAADGRFMGVVAGSIRFSYFHELFDRLNLDADDTVTVLRQDRTIIMRKPFDLDVIGQNLANRTFWQQDNLKPGTSYAGTGPIDAIPRLFVRTSGTGPLFVVVGKPLDSIFRLWREQAIRVVAIMLILIVLALGVSLALAREMSRRAAAEEQLEELATTDPLTGLKNRRKFNATIETEWRRAMRYGTPISLLMIDADHFKAFNDRHGHQAGDEVLIGIAICISDTVRRAGDCAARFGGEEFAVLLPSQTADDAMQLAEQIRQKVQQWSDEPTSTTVSIGIASVTPIAAMDWQALLSTADKALYEAKAAGRNRCMIAPVVPPLLMVA